MTVVEGHVVSPSSRPYAYSAALLTAKLLHKFLREVLRFRHSLVVVVAVVDGNYGTANVHGL